MKSFIPTVVVAFLIATIVVSRPTVAAAPKVTVETLIHLEA